MTRWMWIAAAPTLIAGCAISDDPALEKTGQVEQPLNITAGTRITVEGLLDYGTVVFAENPTTLLEPADFHGYEFDGKAGGVVTISMTGKACGAPDTVLHLFGPEDDSGNRGTNLVENDDGRFASCFFDSQIRRFRLPVDGTYLIVATSFRQRGGGHYRLQLTCDNAACALPDAPTFQASRIAQADIDGGAYAPQELFEIGDFLFETVYRVEDGMGNALSGGPAGTSPRPNFRELPNNVHFAGFGAPEAQTCITCHNVGGDDGAGDRNHNIFQIGDGVNRASGLSRTPPIVLGLGLRQRIGEEMTAQLQGQLAAAKAEAAATGAAVTRALGAKGVSYGAVVANPDGSVSAAGVVGIDPDLVVRPFGVKGREATIRRFIEGGFRVHFGMQSAPSIARHCVTPNVNTFGTGPDCHDPDSDGVVDEITEGQLTAEAVYMGLLEMPVRVPAITSAARARASAGEAVFNTIGCAGCHVRALTIDVPVHVEPADTTGGAGITLHLGTDTRDPHPAVDSNGAMTVELWSDFKRHDMGAALADAKPFNQIAANQFITTPLWGVATSAPYLHDGRAPTLADAILQHAGDSQASRDAFAVLSADNQSKVVEFLGTLGRVESINAAKVDLSRFDLTQTNQSLGFFLPSGTRVPHGGYVVIAHSATRSAFQAFYGRTLGANVVYINAAATGQSFPRINGSETFSLLDSQFVAVDGPTMAQPSTGLRTLSRSNCGAAAAAATSWTSSPSSIAVATPGSGLLSTGQNLICISEIADVGGGGPSGMEFIEIFVE